MFLIGEPLKDPLWRYFAAMVATTASSGTRHSANERFQAETGAIWDNVKQTCQNRGNRFLVRVIIVFSSNWCTVDNGDSVGQEAHFHKLGIQPGTRRFAKILKFKAHLKPRLSVLCFPDRPNSPVHELVFYI